MAYPRLRWRHPVDVVAYWSWSAPAAVAVAAVARARRRRRTLALATAMVLVAHTWWRIETTDGRRAASAGLDGAHRRRAGLVLGIASFATEGGDDPAAGAALLAVVGPALYVGVVLPDIVDVRGLVVRAVVLGVAVVTYVSVFVGAAAVLEVASGRGADASARSAVVGGARRDDLQPLQVMLRGVVDELLFGRRPDPLDAASRVAGPVGEDPVLALRAIREALVLPYAALRADGAELAASGTAVTHTRAFPLDGADAELVVGLRPGDLALRRATSTCCLVAPLLAQTLRARALAADLQESREARPSPRSRRSDGGCAATSTTGSVRGCPGSRSPPTPCATWCAPTRPRPTSCSCQLRAETTHRDRGDPPAGLRHAAAGARRARPGAGAAPAVPRACARRDGRAARGASSVVPDDLPTLSAAVEVAAYRIVVEALTNVARHAGSEPRHGDALRGPVRRCRSRSLTTALPAATLRGPAGVGLVVDARACNRARRHARRPARRRTAAGCRADAAPRVRQDHVREPTTPYPRRARPVAGR